MVYKMLQNTQNLRSPGYDRLVEVFIMDLHYHNLD